jgi:hypothetical protein
MILFQNNLYSLNKFRAQEKWWRRDIGEAQVEKGAHLQAPQDGVCLHGSHTQLRLQSTPGGKRHMEQGLMEGLVR